MKITEIEIGKLKPYKLNAKKHPPEQIDGIALSIKKFGFYAPVVVDENNNIIAGHGRLEAAKLIGAKTVPVVRLEGLSEQDVRALRLIDNRIAETGWDAGILAEEFADLSFDFAPFHVDFSGQFDMPDFSPGTEDDQSKLDEKEPTTCPKCGHSWTK